MAILMVGDSITDWGLWCELTGRNDIANRGIAGDTTGDLIARMHLLNKDVRQAFIMIGINDILQGRNAEEVYRNYRTILAFFKEKGITPFIQSTLYVGEGAPLRVNRNVRDLNRMLQEYATNNAVTFIDLNKKLAAKGFLERRFTLDGLHLTGEGYYVWAETLRSYFMK